MWKPLWLFSVIVMFLQHHQVATAHLCPNMQKLALFQFKLSLSINTSASKEFCDQLWGSPWHPKMMNWSISSDCCMWDGVTCNQMTGDVIGLDLTCSQLAGTIPPNSILFQLSHLQSLNLTGNNFSGPIPRSISRLTQLTYLRLTSNQFSGRIPDSLANLQGLTILYLARNNLVGQFPSWLFDLPLLTNLSLSRNKFSGQINEFNSSRSSLLYFSCGDNLLNGAIPQSFFKLVNHSMVGSSSNNSRGTALDVVKFPHLESLYLSYNNLSMIRITSTATLLPSLRYLGLSCCGIKEFPQFIRYLKNLIFLDMSNNQIVGEIPHWIGSILKANEYAYSYLNISYNSLTGGLEHLPWTNLSYLDLQSNMLNGSLPASICNSSSLYILNLSRNNLSGVLPTCPKSLDNSLRVLDLRMNSIGGSLPSTLSNFFSMETLNLYGNRLEGTIPVSFADFDWLRDLNLGSNKLTGTFPHWLENLRDLEVLILKSNKFHGAINNMSKVEHPFPSLRIFDLSENEFSGPLPTKYLKNFKAMMKGNVDENFKYIWGSLYMTNFYYSDTMIMVIKGVELEFARILTTFTNIDLSRNKFEGEIPKYIGNLVSLRYLNLSHNHLTGNIPSLIGNLVMLESLDLSFNQLVGVIPQQLTSIYTLSRLNLSQNNLIGHIPEGTQFNTFENDSYAGNLGLCGHPMSKKCIIETKDEDEDGDYFFKGFTWKAVVIGYSCGVVVGFVAGYRMFMIGKPKWFTGIIARELGLKVRRMEIRHR